MSEVIRERYKQTKVGVIPEDWDTPRIDTVLQRIRKKVDVEKETLYQQIGIRSHAKGIFHKELVTGEALGNKSVFWIEEDCFIVNIVFAWEQAVAKTTMKERGMIASHRFPMYQPKDNKSDIDYILYFFKSKRGKYLLGLASPGGAGRNKTLGQGEFSELKIPLPSLKEQQKIAQILTTWDDAISKQETLIKAKEELKKGLMQKLLSGEVRFDGFDEEWEEVILKEICQIKKGIQLNKSHMTELGRYPAINGGIKASGYTNEWNTKANTITISEGGNSCGYVNFLTENFWSGGHCYTLQNLKVDKFFLYQVLKLNEISIMRLRVGSGLPNIQKGDIEKFRIQLPSVEEQQKIAEVLTFADKEVELLKNELEALKEQKRGLMQRLLSGGVRTSHTKEKK